MDESFDIVIVGAGTAGCVLAEKLSRDQSVRVLVLEAGGWDWNPLVAVPVGARKLSQYKLYDWGDASEPDAGLDGRRMAIPHGKVVGGGSSINYMAHTRGHPADYDRWAEQGAAGWSNADVLPFFRECEAWEKGPDRWRGGSGEIGVQEARTGDPIYDAWFAMLRSGGYALTSDYNGETNEGFGLAQYAVARGRRSSTAATFLRPALARPNLTVVTHATATKIRFDGKKAVGVEYTHHRKKRVVRSGLRTILCLGAINTPHLLMLSGVGPAEHLRELGIAPLVDLPVGKGLEDHLGIATMWERRKPGAFHASLRLDRIGFNMLRAYFMRGGPAARIPGVILGFLKSRSDLRQPDLEFFLQLAPPDADFWVPGLKPAYRDGFGIRTQLVSQKSQGEIRLRSTDPADRPMVFYNSLSAPEDIVALRDGFKRSWAMGNSPELDEFRGAPTLPSRELKSDAEIDAFIRTTAIQLYHPACTCRMGSGDGAVLNPDLSVRGLENLYVTDASVMPHLVSANPAFAVAMIAARAAAIWNGTCAGTRASLA